MTSPPGVLGLLSFLMRGQKSSGFVLVETTDSPYYSSNTFGPGSHHVYVEVKDAENNTAKTLAVEFNVLSSPSPTPSVSTTQHSVSPSINLSPTQPTDTVPSVTPLVGPEPAYWILYTIAGGVAIFVVVLGLLAIYFRKEGN